MRVLIYSPAYLPRLGGLELNTATLARGLAAAGDEVVVVTTTPDTSGSPGASDGSFDVVRRPSPLELLRWTRWSDVVLHQNLSLRGLWPLGLVRRPLVVAHHSWYRRDGRVGWRERLKRAVVARAGGSVSVSRAIAADLASPSTVVPNAYRAELFFDEPAIARERDLLFVGRLVSDKGVDDLIEALARLAAAGVRLDLTLVGEGPERPALERLASERGVADLVRFAGTLSGRLLADAFRRHRVVVVPSRYDEPFGIVALEAIACGCAVVGSRGGGLVEAIGPCGLTYPNGDVEALVEAIREVAGSPVRRAELRRPAAAHLMLHRPEAMASGYRAVLERAVASRGERPNRRGPRGRGVAA
jgi:glycosyltransferase involved in cell wall biosynthesis